MMAADGLLTELIPTDENKNAYGQTCVNITKLVKNNNIIIINNLYYKES
jgi:hypothetical protein